MMLMRRFKRGCPVSQPEPHIEFEVRMFHAADRTYRWCVTSALPLRDERGNILRWHGTVVDMHDWKQAQEELRSTQAELAHMMRVMTMGELTASIAHELNQPLASIMTNGQTSLRWLAQPTPDVEKIRELTKRIVADARRASEIIDHIRAMAIRRAPQQTLLSLGDLIEELMVFLRPEFQLRGVYVSLDLAPELPQGCWRPHPTSTGDCESRNQRRPGDGAIR